MRLSKRAGRLGARTRQMSGKGQSSSPARGRRLARPVLGAKARLAKFTPVVSSPTCVLATAVSRWARVASSKAGFKRRTYLKVSLFVEQGYPTSVTRLGIDTPAASRWAKSESIAGFIESLRTGENADTSRAGKMPMI